MVPTLVAGLRIDPAVLLRKYILPAPIPVGVRILAGQSVRQLYPSVAVG